MAVRVAGVRKAVKTEGETTPSRARLGPLFPAPTDFGPLRELALTDGNQQDVAKGDKSLSPSLFRILSHFGAICRN